MTNNYSRSDKESFFEENAPLAIDQQIKYGIPASLTLAQMYWESGCGTSDVAVHANNYFGVKDHAGAKAGRPVYRHDDVDEKNAPFKIYDSKEASVQGHSAVLMQRNYSKCHSLASDDFEGWLNGIQSSPSRYAADRNYVVNLMKDYKAYDLGKYDQMAIAKAQELHVQCGYMRDTSAGVATRGNAAGQGVGSQKSLTYIEGFKGFMPFRIGDKYENSMMLTCDYTPDKHDSLHPNGHKGIDLRATAGTELVACENGTVIKVDNHVGNTKGGGNSLTVRYDHGNGTWRDVTYYHLEKSDVEFGESIKAGQIIAKTGNSGSHTTGAHLHMEVKDENGKYMDPKDYLAEVAALGNINAKMFDKKTKTELLASRIENIVVQNANDSLLAQQQGQQKVAADKLQAANPLEKYASLAGFQNMGLEDLAKGDFVGNMMSQLFLAFISLAIKGNRDAQQAEGESQGAALSPKTVPSEDEAYVMHSRRHKESIDGEQLHDQAMMNYDSEMPQQQQDQNISQHL